MKTKQKATRNVWVYYSDGPDYDFDQQLMDVAKRHGGRMTGSGYGLGERDVSFKFKTSKGAEKFKAEVEAIKKVDRADFEEDF